MTQTYYCRQCGNRLYPPASATSVRCPRCGVENFLGTFGQADARAALTEPPAALPLPDAALLDDAISSPAAAGERFAAEKPDFRDAVAFAENEARPQVLADDQQFNPYAPPSAVDVPRKEDLLPASARVGLPWQHETSVHSWFTTAIRVAFLPTIAFRQMKLDDDYNGALGFSIGGALTGWVILNFCLGALMFALTPDSRGFAAAMGQILVNLLCGGIGAVLGMAIGALVWAALFHAGLSLLDANRNGFCATFMVVAFAQGTLLCALPLMVIPFVSAIPSIWMMVVLVIGIRESQQTTTGKASLAVLVPVIGCGVATWTLLLYRIGLLPFANPIR